MAFQKFFFFRFPYLLDKLLIFFSGKEYFYLLVYFIWSGDVYFNKLSYPFSAMVPNVCGRFVPFSMHYNYDIVTKCAIVCNNIYFQLN